MEKTMGEIKVRNLEKTTIQKLDSLAQAKGMTREAYLRAVLESLAISGEVAKVEDKYINLVRTLSEKMQYQTEIIEANTMAMNDILDVINKNEMR